MTDALIQFNRRRFGIFFHWGVYSILGGRYKGKKTQFIGEWIQNYFKIPNSEYEKIAQSFYPNGFDADEWIGLLASAGVKYIVYTAKHHDGFAMYHSFVDSYNIYDFTFFHRDPLMELSAACKKYGVGLGIYYSQNLDWHEQYARNPDPQYGLNVGGMTWGNRWDFPCADNSHFEWYFRKKCIPQLRELLTNYGDICELWFDCEMGMTKEESGELYELVHSLQPNCVVNGRLGNGYHDFLSLGDNQKMSGSARVPVEAPITLNDTWGYKFDDSNWKTARMIVEQLAAMADRNANLLLNIGPNGAGCFPFETIRILRDLSEWNKCFPNAIAGTDGNPFPNGFSWGYCTQRENTLFLFIREMQEKIVLPGVHGRVIRSSVPYSESPVLTLYPDASDSSLLPVVSVEFEANPMIDNDLYIYDRVTELAPDSGTIVHAGQDSSLSYERFSFLTPSSRIETISSKMRIDADGTAADWHDPNDCLLWNVKCVCSGKYRVSLITTQAIYDAPWTGNRTVEIMWIPGNSSACESTVVSRLDTPEALYSPCYASSRCYLGVLDFSVPCEGKIICHTLECKKDIETLGMHFTKLILERIV